MTVAIVDYRAGNLTSVKKAIDKLGQVSVVTADPEVVKSADKIIVPGVGHFGATATLDRSGLREAVESTIAAGKPLLGICLGMQWLFGSSLEEPGARGLGIFAGECGHFPAEVKSPHVGWNQIQMRGQSKLLVNVPADSFLYFTHSFRAPLVEETVAACEYGGTFSAVVERERVFGVQFHPEKSGKPGLQLLETFCGLPC